MFVVTKPKAYYIYTLHVYMYAVVLSMVDMYLVRRDVWKISPADISARVYVVTGKYSILLWWLLLRTGRQNFFYIHLFHLDAILTSNNFYCMNLHALLLQQQLTLVYYAHICNVSSTISLHFIHIKDSQKSLHWTQFKWMVVITGHFAILLLQAKL